MKRLKFTWRNAMGYFLTKDPKGNEENKTSRRVSISNSLKIH